DAISATVFQLLKSVGALTIDDCSLTAESSDFARFSRGTVSVDFDDGYRETMQTVMPILDASGLKMTEYVIAGYLSTRGYVTARDLLEIQSRGHEIGAHTRSHVDLTTISGKRLADEVRGSREDLLAVGAKPVATFAFPYGHYNSSVLRAVRGAGF